MQMSQGLDNKQTVLAGRQLAAGQGFGFYWWWRSPKTVSFALDRPS